MPYRNKTTGEIITDQDYQSRFGVQQIEQPIQFEQPKSLLRKTGEFLGGITGVTGTAKGIMEAGKVAKGLVTGEEYAPQVAPKEFLGSVGKLGLTATTLGTGGIATGLAGRALESGIIGATYQALQNLEEKEKITKGLGTAAAIGGAIPVAGTALAGAKRLFGKGIQATGEKIQTSVIKPSKIDIADGFKVENINKYNLGGSLQSMAQKTEDKITQLASELSSKVKGTDAFIDVKQIARKTGKELLGDKSRLFGNIAGSKRAIQSLFDEINEISPTGLIDLTKAQLVKQAAGQKGAWVFGNADPDAKAVEKVYTAFYRNLRKEIEQKALPGVREINKQISELIPIQNAIIRRIPVAERANVIGLPELISLVGATVSPYSLSIILANKLAKSGKVGSALTKFGGELTEKAIPKTKIGERIFGR